MPMLVASGTVDVSDPRLIIEAKHQIGGCIITSDKYSLPLALIHNVSPNFG